MKNLYKSSRQKKLDGVCGGLADYLAVDPTIVRVLWLATAFLGGIGVIAYIAAMIIVPREPAGSGPPGAAETNRLLLWGLVVAAFGILLFFHNLGWLFPLGFWGLLSATGNLLFPVLFVLLGFVLIMASKRGGDAAVPALRNRRLVRRTTGKMLAGVCAGVAHYFGTDASLVRMIWVVGTLMSLGAGVVLYLVLLVVMPFDEQETGAASADAPQPYGLAPQEEPDPGEGPPYGG